MVKSMVLRELHTLEETTMDKIRFLMSDTGAPFTAACREALEQKGVDVTVVEKDGNKVLQKMLTVRPQVVLLDAFMPGLDALAVKQRYNAAGERHTSSYNKIVVFIDRSPAECYNSFRVLWIGEALLPQRRFLGGSNHSFFVEMLIS